MKRVVSFLIAMMLCLTLAAPVLADEFVPSITVKDDPQIVTIKDANGQDAIGEILDSNGNVIGYLYADCLLITPLSQARTSELIPDHAEELLLDVYNQLVNGTMNIPYEKFNANLDPSTMVIKDLFDVTWLCADIAETEDHDDHEEAVEPAGVTVRLTFRLADLSASAKVFCSSYKKGAWNPVVSCVNNGDGTVTAVFEDFCPVAFSIGESYNTPPAPTGDNSNINIWLIVMGVSVVALGAVLVFCRPKTAA